MEKQEPTVNNNYPVGLCVLRGGPRDGNIDPVSMIGPGRPCRRKYFPESVYVIFMADGRYEIDDEGRFVFRFDHYCDDRFVPTEEGRWIDVPAQRIMVVSGREFRDGYERLNGSGSPPKLGEPTERVVRKVDGRVFRFTRFMPFHSVWPDEYYLEPVET